MRTLDAFCGAGGASIGLSLAGLTSIGIDFNEDACRTHARNGFMTIRADLRKFAFRESQFEFVWGSPPCQPWSAGGKHKGELDDRDCIPAWLEIIKAIRPKYLVMENVKGLTFKTNRTYLGWIVQTLDDFGYWVKWRVLNAADYGVPQSRPRFILIGRLDSREPHFPDLTHSKLDDDLFAEPWIPMGQALGWDENKHVAFPRRSDDIGGEVVIDGDKFRARDFTSSDEPSKSVTSKGRSWKVYTGLDWKPGGDRFDAQAIEADKPAPTVGAKAGGQWWTDRPATVVQGDPRVFTPGGHRANDGRDNSKMVTRADCIRVSNGDLAALQGFPPDYEFVGTMTSVARQIGNAVPPPMAAAIVSALLDD